MALSLDANKKQLRKAMKALRSGIPSDEREAIDALICEKLCAMPQFEQADVVFAYLSFGAEVSTREIIRNAWAAGKAVAIPRCTGVREMRWFRIDSFDDLEVSSLGVEEPRIDSAREQFAEGDVRMIALVPGLAFDAQGYRLGYGGGFYDTFLSSFPGASIGLCRHAQFVEDLREKGVIDAHDLPVDIVVTDR